MSGRRPERVAGAVRAVIADLLLREVKDPRVGFVTLTTVRVSDDLRHCTVYFSCVGDAAARARALSGLRSASGFIRRQLLRQLDLRYAPELTFAFDPGLEASARLGALLGAGPPADE